MEFLKQQIEEKDKEINELKRQKENVIGDISNIDNKISELNNLLEKEKNNTYNNLDTISKQENKIESMRNMVKELDNQIEIQLKLKDQKASDKLEILNKQNQSYVQEINRYKSKFSGLNQKIQKTNNDIGEIEEEKNNMQNIISKQEEKLTGYIDKLNELEIVFKRKNKLIKENEAYAKELIKLVEEQKKTIAQLRNAQNNGFENRYRGFNNNKSVDIKYNNNIILPNIKNNRNNIKSSNTMNEDTKNNKNNNNIVVESNSYENMNDTSEINQKNVSLIKDLADNDENNQRKLREFKNFMDNLVNGLNDIKDI
jgi:hypothetical protein